MPKRKFPPRPGLSCKLFTRSCLIAILALLLIPSSALAHSLSTHSTSSVAAGPSFTVNAGFDSRYRDGNWIPIQVALRNPGADFNGVVSVNVPAPFSGSVPAAPLSTYQEEVNLPSGAQKEVTLYVPFNLGTQGAAQTVTVNLLDTSNHLISSQTTTLRSLGPTDIFVGVLSNQSSGFGPLAALPLSDQTASVIIEPLNASSMPTIADALSNFDLLVIDNFTTSSLSPDQLTALQNWVSQGGNLIVVGGPEWRQTLSPLPGSLLPVTPTATDTLPARTHLLPFTGPQSASAQRADTINAPVVISTATADAGSHVLLSAGTTPLIVRSQLGRGSISYLAYDPTLDPLVNWSNATTMWKDLLLRTLGDQILATNASSSASAPGWSSSNSSASGMGVVLQSLFPTSFLATWLILLLLFGYILVLGPVRLLIVRQVKNRDWSWRIVLSTIALFSIVSYGLALQQKGTSILSSSISVLQLSYPGESSTTAHVTTYVGVFVPNQGDFQVHIPGLSLVQPANTQSRFQNQSQAQPTTITSNGKGVDVNLQGVNIWTLRTLTARHDSQIAGKLLPHLTMQNDTLTGSVTNTLPYSLNDAYLLINDHYASLGHMAAGETKQIYLSLKANPNGPQGTSFADQIASSKGLSVPYSPYMSGSQSQSEFQRHMAMLAALSNEISANVCNGNGVCFQSPATRFSVTSSGLVISGNGSYNLSLYNQILSGNDPLLISGAPATLIGWADHPNSTGGNVTINGNYTSKVQEALVQAPLAVNFVDPVNLPANFVTSQLVDVEGQGNSLQTLFPGVYAMNSGSMTFEFTLPAISNLHARSLIFSMPTTLPQVGSASGQNSVDANHLQANLYNWQTRSWDSYTFNVFTFSTTNSQRYVGPGGRILLQLTNPDATQGTAIFGKPNVQLQDSSAS